MRLLSVPYLRQRLSVDVASLELDVRQPHEPLGGLLVAKCDVRFRVPPLKPSIVADNLREKKIKIEARGCSFTNGSETSLRPK